jgi:hypothetical protein
MWNPRPSRLMFRAVLFTLLVVGPRPASAQTQNVTGYDAVYSSTGKAPSPSFIDASVSQKINGTNLCATIYNIFAGNSPNPGYPAAGAVIDARGISGSTALTCASGTTPWNNGSNSVNLPSTILLPAGTIVIPTAWALPSNTHVIGQGDNIGSGTTLQACNSAVNSCSFGSSSMIQFGLSACSPCTGIAIENLNLDGQGQTISGIVNQYSGSLSYVDHVSLYQILVAGPPLRSL